MAYRLNLKDSADALDIDVLEIPLADDFIEGASDNTTLDGNIFTDYLYLKKQYSYKWATMDAETYDRLKGFYTRQWSSKKYPYFTLSDQNTTQDIRAETHATFYGAPIEYSNGIILNSYEIYGDTEQTTTTGKNLIEPQNGTAQGITSSYNEQTGAVTFSGTSNTTYTVPPAFAKTYEPGTYTLTIDSPQQVRVGVGFWTGASSSTRKTFAIQAGQTKATYELTEPAQQADVFLTGLTSGTTYNLTVKVMLEKGAGSANFEPYTAGTSPNPTYPQEVKNITGRAEFRIDVEGVYSKSVELNLGKNLFDKENAAVYSGYFTSNNLVRANSNGRMVIIPIEAGATYTWSTLDPGAMKSDSAYAFLTKLPEDNDPVLGKIIFGNTSSRFTTTAPARAKFLAIYCAWNTDTALIYQTWQLERGAEATSYTPYKTPIELCKIGNYQDRIYKSGWRWFIERKIWRVNLANVAQAWANADYANRKRIYQSMQIIGATGKYANKYTDNNFVETPAICPRFRNTSVENILGEKYRQAFGISSSNTLSIQDQDTTTYEQLVAEIRSAPTWVYYVLETPFTEEITDSELIMQLESIPYSYLGNMPGVISLTASNGMVAPLSADINYWYYEHMPTPIYDNRPVRMELSDDGVVDCCGTRQGVKITLRETRQQ